MFENFTESAIEMIMLSQNDATSLNQDFIGLEQIFRALLNLKEGIAFETIKQNKINYAQNFKDKKRIIKLTLKAEKMLKSSCINAEKTGYNKVSTGHVLLYLMNETDSVITDTLNGLGINSDKLKFDIEENIKNNGIKSEYIFEKY